MASGVYVGLDTTDKIEAEPDIQGTEIIYLDFSVVGVHTVQENGCDIVCFCTVSRVDPCHVQYS